MLCQWCGSGRKVKEVRRNGVPMVGPVEGVPLHLCYFCWGLLRESGTRRDQTGQPTPGPISGIPLTGSVLRQMGR